LARKEIEALKPQAAARESLGQENAAAKKTAEQERARAEGLARELASARNEIEGLKRQVAASSQSTAALAPTPPVSSGNQNPEAARNRPPPPSPEEGRLLARAETLIREGDIRGAQLLLARGLASGSARAAFLLAQTYDPRQLSSWGVRGIPGDAAKAQELYVRAYTGGVSEAKERLEANR
jgi:septal ring factor EnvC (AmiA/AmiB activator)